MEPLPKPRRYEKEPKLTATETDDNDVYVDVCQTGSTDVYFRHSTCDMSERHNAAGFVRTFLYQKGVEPSEVRKLASEFYWSKLAKEFDTACNGNGEKVKPNVWLFRYNQTLYYMIADYIDEISG